MSARLHEGVTSIVSSIQGVTSIEDAPADVAEQLRRIADDERALLRRVMLQSNLGRASTRALATPTGTLDQWYRTISGKILVHDHYAYRYRSASYVLSIMIIVLNACVSGLVFLNPDSMGESASEATLRHVLKYTTGIVSTIVTVLAAVNSKLKWGELSEGHEAAKKAFVRLKRRMDMLRDVRKLPLVNPPDCHERDIQLVEGEVHPEWKDFLRTWEETAGDAPAVSLARTRRLVKRHLEEARDEVANAIGS